MFLAPTDNLFDIVRTTGGSQRVRRYTEPTDGQYYYIRTEIPLYQDYCTNCPACGADLHHSTGWDRRVCDLCGFVEGAFDYRTYPTAYRLDEYIYLIGVIYQMMKAGQINSTDGSEWIESITTYGSHYRPANESE